MLAIARPSFLVNVLVVGITLPLQGRCASIANHQAAYNSQRVAATSDAMAVSAISIRAQTEVIPEYRLGMILPEPGTLNPKLQEEQHAASIFGGAFNFQSTPGQDSQRCPLLKLPSDFYFSGHGKHDGFWSIDNGIKLVTWHSTWTNSAFLNGVQQVAFQSAVDEKLAFTSKKLTLAELRKLSGWEAANFSLTDNTSDPNMIRMLESSPALSAYHKEIGAESVYEALMDCDGRLLFVIRLIPYPDGSLAPGHPIEIYGRDGGLLARTIMDPRVERIQFVDMHGYLVATAESPGLNVNISRTDMFKEFEGKPLPYSFHFEQGGYVNSSHLMDTDYHWVIAAAVQVKAVFDAGHKQPEMSTVAVLFSWIGLVLGLCFIGLMLWGIYLLVYPKAHFVYNPPIYQKRPMYAIK